MYFWPAVRNRFLRTSVESEPLTLKISGNLYRTTILTSYKSSENWMSRRARRENGEDDSLSSIAREAEARLAAKRAARAEAREIRLKELEKQQREVNIYIYYYRNHYRNFAK